MKRVLVVDDEPDVRLLLKLQLEARGFEVVGESADGAHAVRVFEASRPDAVVLDLLMPGMTGFEAIPRLREVDENVAIIAYTAVAGDFVRREMARMQVPVVLKSGDITPLVDAIESALTTTS